MIVYALTGKNCKIEHFATDFYALKGKQKKCSLGQQYKYFGIDMHELFARRASIQIAVGYIII